MTVPRLALLAALAVAACHAPPPSPLTPAQAPGAALLGRWEYVAPRPSPAPPSLNAGLRVAVEFDSAAGARFSGRVVTWFAGDLGLAPALFGRVEGEVAAGGSATFAIPLARPGAPPYRVTCVVRGDTLAITAARRGDEPGPFSTAAGAAFVRRSPGSPTAPPSPRSR